MAISTYLPIITLNVNGLNAPIKRHSMADWMKKQKQKQEPVVCCLQETSFRVKDTQTESEGIKMDSSCERKHKESGGSNIHIRQNRL